MRALYLSDQCAPGFALLRGGVGEGVLLCGAELRAATLSFKVTRGGVGLDEFDLYMQC